MYLVLIKFLEVFTRAGFVIGTTYSLSLTGAGQFGIVVTLVGLFAFAFNWERQVDIQRRHVDSDPGVFDRAVRAAAAFWAFNQLLMLPVFLLACWLMAGLSPLQLALAAVIVSCEHVANQTYQMALISRRYWRFITLVAAKNAAVLLAVLPYILFAPSQLTIDYALTVWALGQVVCAIVVFLIWFRVREHLPHDEPFSLRARIFVQHRASFTHFQIGLVAILALQFDRLAVGAVLPLDQTGIYFRHILIVSFLYQFFNVAFYNRALPTIFATVKAEGVTAALARIRRDLLTIFALVAVGLAVAIGIDTFFGGAISRHYHLSLLLITILTFGALFRVTADFLTSLFHARMLEKLVLRSQLVALTIGGLLILALAAEFGVLGAAAANAIASILYFTLIRRAMRRLDQEPVA